MIVRVLGIALLLSLAFGAVQTVRLYKAKSFHDAYVLAIKEEMVKTYRALTQERNAAEEAIAEAGTAYNKGVKDAAVLYDTTIKHLHANTNELQQHWRSALRRADEAETALAGVLSDGEAESVRRDLAGFVQRSAESDARILSLQDTVNAYLCQVNKKPYTGFRCP